MSATPKTHVKTLLASLLVALLAAMALAGCSGQSKEMTEDYAKECFAAYAKDHSADLDSACAKETTVDNFAGKWDSAEAQSVTVASKTEAEVAVKCEYSGNSKTGAAVSGKANVTVLVNTDKGTQITVKKAERLAKTKEDILAELNAKNAKSAASAAKNYLAAQPYSEAGLRKVLEKEGYPAADIEAALNNCGANWDEQAAKAAAVYRSVASISHKELVDMLETDGFTHEQAEHGATEAEK